MVAIRRGETRDSEAVYLLARQFVQDERPTNRDEFEVAFANTVRPRENETNVLYVAVSDAGGAEDGTVVGYSLMTVSRLLHTPGLTAHLQEIVVEPGDRNAGIGSRLVQANELYCQARGVRQLTMATSLAGGFYTRLGYTDSATFYKKIFDAH